MVACTVLGLFSLAIGALLRTTGAGITGVVGFVLVLAPLAQLLPGRLGTHVHAYLPSEAGQLIARAHQDKDDLLAPWQGLVATTSSVACLRLGITAAAIDLLFLRGSGGC